MTLQIAQPMPTPIQPIHGAIYRLDGGHHRLMNGMALCVVAHLVNFGTVPATVSGCVSGTAGLLTIEAREAFLGRKAHRYGNVR